MARRHAVGSWSDMERLILDRDQVNAFCHGDDRFILGGGEARTEVDALVIMDDWGAQNALLINPQMWQRVFKPLYAEYAAIAQAAGKKLFMHSDGQIAAIYPDLIEIGVDAINSQLFCMGIEELGREYKGRITFWGEIDRQQILPHGTVDQVRDAVRHVARHLYDPAGGVIAQFSWEEHTTVENAHTVFGTWEEISAASIGAAT